MSPGRIAPVAVAHFSERVALTAAALFLSRDGGRWAIPSAVALGGLFLLRASLRAALRMRVRRSALEALVLALLSNVGSDDARPETEAALVEGLQASEDILAQRVPELVGDVPAALVLTALVVATLPHDLVIEGAVGVAIGAAGALAVRRTTASLAQEVFDAFIPALDDLVIAIYGRVEIIANGDEGAFLASLTEKLRAWESRSLRASRVSGLAGRAPIVGAGVVVGALILARGGIHDAQWAAAGVIASVTPAFVGIARGTIDLGRDIVRVEPMAALLEHAPLTSSPGRTAARGNVAWNDVTFAYGSERPALQGVTAQWRPGEFLAVAGKNGSGKSTFVRLVLGLAPPSSGEITVGGDALPAIAGRAYRQRIGYLAQRSFLPDRMSVADAVRLLAPTVEHERIRAKLEEVGVWPTLARRNHASPLDAKLGTLSAGEKQRVAIARVLLRDADMLILDEPDANLDREGTRLLASLLRREATKRMVLVVAHEAELLEAADRVLHFAGGRLEEAPRSYTAGVVATS